MYLHLKYLVLGIIACTSFTLPLYSLVEVVDLKCEYAENPLGVDLRNPRLYWRMESGERGQEQTAWRVLVAYSQENLDEDRGDLWDSGKRESGQSIHVPYEGERVGSTEQVYWKVRVWDKDDEPSDWSDVATWTTGRFHDEQWKGKWIGAPARHESTMLRREFPVKPDLKRAVLHVSGLGHYEAFINGERVGNDLLTPGWTNYNESTLYNTYDVTDHVRIGDNAIGLVLGNGMYHVERRNRFAKFEGSFGPKRVIADIEFIYEDGSREIVGTDDRWKTHPGAITYSSIYGGEDYDAQRYQEGWDKPGFDDQDWAHAVAIIRPSKDTLRGHRASAPPIRVIDVREPVEVRKLSGDGAWVYDFGQNTSYMPQLKIHGPAGSKVRLIPGEIIYPDGYVSRASMGGIDRGSSWWEYTKATDEPESWFPQFYYVGSRYFQVQLMPAQGGDTYPEIEELNAAIVHSEADPLGDFETSNELVNRIRNLVRWAQRSNMVSVLTDCPHREKLGWLEQYHLNGPAIRYEWDTARIYEKGMQDMADSQTWQGLVPNIAPEYTEFSGTFRAAAEWGASFIVVPWQQYQFNGDTELMRRHYEDMKRYFRYLESKAEDDVLSEGLGDWYDLGPRKLSRSELTLPPVTATAFFYYDAWILSRVAEILGHNEDSEHFARRAEEIRNRFNEAFYQEDGGYYAKNSQAANALPLVMGIVEEENRETVLESLVEDVVERGYSMTAGDVGFRYLLQALSGGGHNDVIYKMINHERNPGYGYQLKMGATALTESWDADPSDSNNHFMLGHITEWFYKDLLGIQADMENPGFKHIRIDPHPVGDLDWVKGSYDSLYGPIKVRWEVAKDSFQLNTTVPPNTTATVYLPAENENGIQESGQKLTAAPGVKFIKMENGRAVIEIESGTYQFVSEVSFQPNHSEFAIRHSPGITKHPGNEVTSNGGSDRALPSSLIP